MADDQFTVDESNTQGEQQDTVAEREDKADVLAEDVIVRETFEKRTAMIILSASMFLMVASFSALAYGLQQVNAVASQNTKVICSLREGYVQQLESNKKFIEANPNGGVILGVKFTREDLDQQRIALERRLATFSGVEC